MGYQVTLDESAQAQADMLPNAAFEHLAEALTVLELVPWNGLPFNPRKPDATMRTLAFGRFGLITYLVLERQQRVDILQVVWAGPGEGHLGVPSA